MKEEMKGNQDHDKGRDRKSDCKGRNRFSKMKVLAASIMTVFALGAASGCKTDQKCQELTCSDATACMTTDASVMDGSLEDGSVRDAGVDIDGQVDDGSVTDDAVALDASLNDSAVDDADVPDANMEDGGFTEDAAITDGSVDASQEDASVYDDGGLVEDADISVDADVEDGAVDEDAQVGVDAEIVDGGFTDGSTACVATAAPKLWHFVGANDTVSAGGYDMTVVSVSLNPKEVTVDVVCPADSSMVATGVVVQQGQSTVIPLGSGMDLTMYLQNTIDFGGSILAILSTEVN